MNKKTDDRLNRMIESYRNALGNKNYKKALIQNQFFYNHFYSKYITLLDIRNQNASNHKSNLLSLVCEKIEDVKDNLEKLFEESVEIKWSILNLSGENENESK